MTQTYQRLGADRPSDMNERPLYTVPANTQVTAILDICNQTGSQKNFSVALTDNTGSLTPNDWLFYEKPIAENDTIHVPGIAMKAGEVLRVKSLSPDDISFVFRGMIISPTITGHEYGRQAALLLPDTAEHTLFTTPVNSQIMSMVTICNQDSNLQFVSLAHVVGGGSANPSDWIFYNRYLFPNETLQLTNVSSKMGEAIRVKASVGNKISYVLSGLLIT